MSGWVWQKKEGYYCKNCYLVFRAHGSAFNGYCVQCPSCRRWRAFPIRWDPDAKTMPGAVPIRKHKRR